MVLNQVVEIGIGRLILCSYARWLLPEVEGVNYIVGFWESVGGINTSVGFLTCIFSFHLQSNSSISHNNLRTYHTNLKMPVTELALLRLLDQSSSSPSSTTTPTTTLPEPLLTHLTNAKSLMQSSSPNSTFHYLLSLSHPSHIYILGQWPSLSAHVDVFIPSAAN
jgi:hypothetical protein